MISPSNSGKRENRRPFLVVIVAVLVIVAAGVGIYYCSLLTTPKPPKIGDVKVTRSEMFYVGSGNSNSTVTTSYQVSYEVEFMNETDHFVLTDYVTPGLELERIRKSRWQDLGNVEVKEANISYSASEGKMFVEIRPHNKLSGVPQGGDGRTYSDKYNIIFRSGLNMFLDEYPAIVMSPPCIASDKESIVNITLAGFRIADMGNLSSVHVESRLNSSVTCQRLDAPPADPDDPRLVTAHTFGSFSCDFPEYRAVYSIKIPTETQDPLLSYQISLTYNKHLNIKGDLTYQGGNVSWFIDESAQVTYRYNYNTCRA